MSERLIVRVYNVGFGDAVLVFVPDRDEAGRPVTHHILIDVGNVLAGPGSGNAVYDAIFTDVLQVLNGRRLDLYISTHEHLDHVEGPLHAAVALGKTVKADHVWMTASAEGDAYYERHPDAKRKKLALEETFRRLRPLVAASGSDRWRNMLVNNDFEPTMTAAGRRASTRDCISHIREEMGGAVHYLYAGAPMEGAHGFREASFRILAPVENTAEYYGRSRPFSLTNLEGDAAGAGTQALPPPGVDAGAFYDLVRSRGGGFPETLLAIDKAANDTSLVVELTWRGRRLLFVGDAELGSWKKMLASGGLQPVDFLKVGHHGSHNGTPFDDLDALLPPREEPRQVAVSTCCGAYNGVPHGLTMEALGKRATVHDTRTVEVGKYIDVVIEVA